MEDDGRQIWRPLFFSLARLDTAEQLSSFVENIKLEKSKLKVERGKVVNKLRRCRDEGQAARYKERRAELTNRLKRCRNDLRHADGIMQRSERMKENLKKVDLERQLVANQLSKKRNRTRSQDR